MLTWVTDTIHSLGYVGIALLMFLENIFPPIPSELIMPLAGFTAAQGKMDFIAVVTAGTVGTVLGAMPWYYAGKYLGEARLKALANRYGKWFSLSSRDVEQAKRWFDRYGSMAVFFCRLVPGVRTLISVPAGLSNMSLGPFLVYSTLGSFLWSGLLAYAGYALGSNYQLVEEYLGPASKVVLIVLVVGFIGWVVRRNWQKKRRRNR